MLPRSTTDLAFEHEAQAVLSELGEIACIIRFSHSAGNRSFEFFRDLGSFRRRLRVFPSSTSVIVFRDRQLPLRGVVDDEFVATAKNTVRGKHWTITRTSLITMGSQSWYHHIDGDTIQELEEELRGSFCWGHPVAVGEEPDWLSRERTIEAIVPNSDGAVRRGIY